MRPEWTRGFSFNLRGPGPFLWVTWWLRPIWRVGWSRWLPRAWTADLGRLRVTIGWV